MITNDLNIIVLILKSISGVFGILAAVCTLYHIMQNDDHKRTINRFGDIYFTIHNSKWSVLPQFVISKFSIFIIKINNIINNLAFIIIDIIYRKKVKDYNTSIIKFIQTIILFLIIFIIIFTVKYSPRLHIEKKFPINLLLFGISGYTIVNLSFFKYKKFGEFYTSILLMIMSILFIDFILLTKQIYSLFLMIFLFPIFISIMSQKIRNRHIYLKNDQFFKKINILYLSLGISAPLTIIGALIGSVVTNTSEFYISLQLLLSNYAFDTLSILLSIFLLKWAITSNVLIRLPLIVFIDCLLATIFAILSIHVGYLFSNNQLNITQLLPIFYGKTYINNQLHLGPLFWIMHSTFIPTCIYLTIIMLGWFLKVILIPMQWFLKKGYHHKNPMALTAAICTVFCLIFKFSADEIKDINEMLNKEKVKTNNTEIKNDKS